MPRPPRLLFAGGLYHVIARGNNRMRIFHDKQDFRFYRKLWREAKVKFSLKIHRWCFMSNHIHFIVLQQTLAGLPNAMHYIQQRYAKYYGRRYQWVGHVWQGRYTSRLIADDKYLVQCSRYVENNPVEAGVVDRPEDYLWSSAYARARGFKDGLYDELTLFTDVVPSSSSLDYREKCIMKLDRSDLRYSRRILGSPTQKVPGTI